METAYGRQRAYREGNAERPECIYLCVFRNIFLQSFEQQQGHVVAKLLEGHAENMI